MWTPSLNDRTTGIAYPNWFAEEEEHEDHVFLPPKKGRRSLASAPDYCTAVPYFVSPTPEDATVIEITEQTLKFTLKAKSQLAAIHSFSYQAPMGLTCTDVSSEGSVDCEWTATVEQLKIAEHPFCFSCTDTVGLTCERRCLKLVTKEEEVKKITNIFEMSDALLKADQGTFSVNDVVDYGCAGRGLFEPFAKTEGKQIDHVDHAFFSWKKCIQCAAGGDRHSPIPAYDYTLNDDHCGKIQ